MEVVVLGSGCSKCHSTMGLVERVAKALGIAVNLTLNESKEDRERLRLAKEALRKKIESDPELQEALGVRHERH